MTAEHLFAVVKVTEREKKKMVMCVKIKNLALKMMEECLKHC